MTSNAHAATLALFAPSDNATRENELTKEVLEALIDRFGLGTVTSAMADVCGDKAEHIRANWNDDRKAKSWEGAAIALNRTAISQALEVR